MGRAFVGDDLGAGDIGLGLGGTFKQQGDAAVQPVDLGRLPGHDLGQILDRAGQLGHHLFQFLHTRIHTRQIGQNRKPRQPRLPPGTPSARPRRDSASPG